MMKNEEYIKEIAQLLKEINFNLRKISNPKYEL